MRPYNSAFLFQKSLIIQKINYFLKRSIKGQTHTYLLTRLIQSFLNYDDIHLLIHSNRIIINIKSSYSITLYLTQNYQQNKQSNHTFDMQNYHKILEFQLQSKSRLIEWLKKLIQNLPEKLKIQDLGTGFIWCKLINCYYPNTISLTQIISSPKNQYQIFNNLKQLQNAFVLHKIDIPINIYKISKMKFLQNWTLAIALYKYFNFQDSNNDQAQKYQSKLKTIQMEKQGNISHHISNQSLQLSKIQPLLDFNLTQSFQISQLMINNIRKILVEPSKDSEKVKRLMGLLNLFSSSQIVKFQSGEFQTIRKMPRQRN